MNRDGDTPDDEVVYGLPAGGGELVALLRDDGTRHYSEDEVVTLLQRAADMGFPLDSGTFLDGMTIQQLDALVGDRSRGD